MTAEMAAMKWAASSPAPTPSSGAPAVAASRTTGPATATTTAETSATRTRPAEVDQHVRTPASPFNQSDQTNSPCYHEWRQCIYYMKCIFSGICTFLKDLPRGKVVCSHLYESVAVFISVLVRWLFHLQLKSRLNLGVVITSLTINQLESNNFVFTLTCD